MERDGAATDRRVFVDNLNGGIESFIRWHDGFGDLSFDRMDYWSSAAGIRAKKIFYKNKLRGAPGALWGLALETLLPGVQKRYGVQNRQPIGDAHFASAYLDQYELTGDARYLQRAEGFLEALVESSCAGYSGLCWGYAFGWETANGYWPPGVPLITITPYGFWAFADHFRVTGDEESRARALSSAEFALNDLNEREMPDGTFCSSYSPTTHDIVINANSYRAAMLLGAFELSGDERFLDAGRRPLAFVLASQASNGAWYYEAKPPQDNFIDHFHTCFVLRNLARCHAILPDEDVLQAIRRGFGYYVSDLFRPDGRPRHFSVAKYPKLRRYEMYDFAESIKLGTLVASHIDGALDRSIRLADDLLRNFQLPDGHFPTRVTSFGTVHRVPYLRWPQAQLLSALTTLARTLA